MKSLIPISIQKNLPIRQYQYPNPNPNPDINTYVIPLGLMDFINAPKDNPIQRDAQNLSYL